MFQLDSFVLLAEINDKPLSVTEGFAVNVTETSLTTKRSELSDSKDGSNDRFSCSDYDIFNSANNQTSAKLPGCVGGSDGNLRYVVNSSEFKGDIIYEWIDPNGNTFLTGKNKFQTDDNLSAGVYTLRITGTSPETERCTYEKKITLAEPAARFTINTNSEVTHVSCAGNDGAIDLEVQGANNPANLSYEWISGPAKVGTKTQDISGLPAGDYEVKIVESGSPDHCEIHKFTVNAFTAITITPTKVDVNCNGASTGSITLTVSGGSGTYTYEWDSGQTTKDLSGLAAGTYNVTVTDSNGCTDTSPVTITEPATALSLSNTQVNVLCNGASTGSIDLTVTGGTAGYTYAWSNGSTAQDISSLTAGTYTVNVTDAKGCTATSSVTITQPAAITLSTSKVDVSCNGGTDGSINLSVAGGTAPYTYLWNNAATSEDLSSLAAGSYNVTVTDAVGCTATAPVTITQPAVLALSTSKVDVSCNGGTDGSINLTVAGGTAPFTYAWNNGATTEDISSLPAGNYNVTVTDAKGCTDNAPVTITAPPALALSNTKVNISCSGATDGSIDLTVTGGNGAYTYLWSNGATTQDLNALAVGTYTVTVTDAKGCTANASITLTEPVPTITGTPTITNVSCNGDTNGSVSLVVGGGTAPYAYLWSNGATTKDVSNLAAGTYSVKITDKDGCLVISNITVNQPAVLAISSTKVDVNCKGGTSGTIDLTVTGGTAPYTYLWSNAATTQDLSSLAAGTFSVTVTDAKGCTVTGAVTITEPAALVLSSTKVDANCNGVNNGRIDLNVTGGTAPYTYAWNTGATTQNLSSLAAGTYSVTVTDAKGCTSTTSATITVPPPIVLSNAQVNLSCTGDTNGSIDLTVTGGTGPYTYLWNTGASTQDLTGIKAGTYTITVTDSKGCTSSKNITLTEPPATIKGTPTVTNVSCNGGNDGKINLSITGGKAPYTYLWSNGVTTKDVSNLAAGTYSVRVTDKDGCLVISNIVVTAPSALAISSTKVNLSCQGSRTGAIDLSVSGGTAPYTYVWNNAATTQDLSGLAAGTYSVTVRDAKGCTATSSVTVTEPAALALTNTKLNVSCSGANDGSIGLTVTGGTAPYTYAWSTGTTSQNLTSIKAGAYTVTVTDRNGCTVNTSISITEPATNISATAVVTDINCKGTNDGAINLTVSGGIEPYSFLWSNGMKTEDVTGLAAGSYDVTIRDVNNCLTITGIIVSEPPVVLSATATTQDNSCNAGAQGAINLEVSGGTAPYTYSWSNGQTIQDINNLTAGNYTVNIVDAKGCTITKSYTIIEPTPIAITEVKTDVSCFGLTNGKIDVSVTGGTAPYQYNWSSGQSTQDISNIKAGTYVVTVTDANGCTEDLSIVINEPPAIVLTAASTQSGCNGGSDGTVDLTVTGGTAPYSYSWNNGASTEDLKNLTFGIYTVVVTDANGCSNTLFISVNENDNFVPTVASSNISCFGGTDGNIDLSISGGQAPYTYSWSNGQTTEDVNNLVAGTYTVTITDANNCRSIIRTEIVEPTALTVVTTSTDLSCNGANNGTLTLALSGSTAPYGITVSSNPGTGIITTISNASGCDSNTYRVNSTNTKFLDFAAWTIETDKLMLTGLPEGTYSVIKVADNSLVGTSIISEPSPVNFVESVVNNVSCNNGIDGSIGLKVTGGLAPYFYLWSNGRTEANISQLSSGAYTLKVTDANNCISTISFNVVEPEPLLVLATQVNVLCFGENSGSINLDVRGGVAPYTVDWGNGISGLQRSNLSPGDYAATVTDASGCTFSVSATLTQPSPLDMTTNVIPVFCFGEATGRIEVAVSGGTAPYTYSWSNNATTSILTGLLAGSYNLTVTDANNCSISTQLEITEPPALVTSALQQLIIDCENKTIKEEITAVVIGGSAPYLFSWDGLPFELGNLFEVTTSGNHTIMIQDANGCESVVNVISDIPTFGESSIDVSGTIDPFGNYTLNTAVQLGLIKTDNIVSWSWDLGDGTISSEESFEHIYTNVGQYTIRLQTTDDNGCTDEKLINITVNLGYEIIMPTAFTPNGDGLNDRLYPEFYGLTSLRLVIYNKWGEAVFVSENIESGGWAGLVKNTVAPSGAYAYKLYANSLSGKAIEKSGSFMLVKK